MPIYCVGCGEPFARPTPLCARCRTPAVGADFSEEVRIAADEGVPVPPVCCCCLNPIQETHEEEFSSNKYRLRVPLPWCYECRARKRWVSWALAATFFASWGLGLVALRVAGAGDLWQGFGSLGFAFAAAVAVGLLLDRFVPSLRLPGHVKGCAAVTGSASASGGRVVFGNRAFAQVWREMKQGRRPSLAAYHWEKPAVSKEVSAALQKRVVVPVAPPTPASRASSTPVAPPKPPRPSVPTPRAEPPPIQRRWKPSLRTGVSESDAAAAALRFVVRECRFDPEGLVAKPAEGGERRLRWDELAEVIVRQLPPDPPFERIVILDLVPAAAEPPTPVRIVPLTRANYAELPGGAGRTSQENFRRLVAFAQDRHPGLRLEAGSVAFFRDGHPPPMLAGEAQFRSYEARYR